MKIKIDWQKSVITYCFDSVTETMREFSAMLANMEMLDFFGASRSVGGKYEFIACAALR